MKQIIGDNGNTYEILYGYDICDQILTDKTKQYLKRINELDTQLYGGEDKGEDCIYVGSIENYMNRFGYVKYENTYSLDPESGVVDNIIAVAQNGNILGYITYLTVDDELYDEILHPDVEKYLIDPARRDEGIKGTQLRQWSKERPNHLFIVSVAVDKNYQDSNIIKIITNSFREELVQKEKDGYHIGSITADTVSDHGEKLARMLRCEIVKNDGKEVILPAPESDKSGHEVIVYICEGNNLELLLQEGFSI